MSSERRWRSSTSGASTSMRCLEQRSVAKELDNLEAMVRKGRWKRRWLRSTP